jgi:Tol biopolymer transport system component
LLGSAAAFLLAAFGIWLWRGKAVKPVEHAMTRLTSNGVSHGPAISPDGEVIAYASYSGFEPNIWTQRVGGGSVVQITNEKDGAGEPVFSPDGRQIMYVSFGLMQVYEVPAFGGMPRLIANDADQPLYTLDGATVILIRNVKGWHVFLVPRTGGTPVELQPEFRVRAGPLPLAGGSWFLLAGYRQGHLEDLTKWWKISNPEGKLEGMALPRSLNGGKDAPAPLALTVPEKGSRQWAIFGRPLGNTTNLFRVALDSTGRPSSDPEQITFSSGQADSPSISRNGRMVFENRTETTNIWSIPIDANAARVNGDRQDLTKVEGISYWGAALSHDGTLVAFFSDNGQPGEVADIRHDGRLVVRDLTSGREKQLAQNLSLERVNPPVISPDGKTVAYYNLRPASAPDIYLVSTVWGEPRPVCQECGFPRAFSSDGKSLLVNNRVREGQPYGIASIELATGKVMDILHDARHEYADPALSWDDRWMLFQTVTDRDSRHPRIYVTPIEKLVPAGPEHWIQLTSGDYREYKPKFSPDGSVVYFASNRDGSTCLWAQRLDQKTKRAVGKPFSVQHFHGSQRVKESRSSGYITVNVAKGKIVTDLEEVHSDIWMIQLDR